MQRLKQHRLVYLGTPYTKYARGIEQAFKDAANLAATLLVAGVKVYSPIAHTHPLAIYGGLDPLDHDIWLPFDVAMMDASDAMVIGALPGWQESYGVKFEIATFRAAQKPVYLLDPATLNCVDYC